ncbi:CCHC-type domain-containing protein [Plasmodiophora brassicae]|uniref:CCHC-type domain-containing protein n=1 Tax=Plasmodiophora brassicae TaxID=37360 RepID=A0A0G4ISN8_PLABS|nr:hypothetical protein PBRA_006492 [Plasmodiophora brassicae]
MNDELGTRGAADAALKDGQTVGEVAAPAISDAGELRRPTTETQLAVMTGQLGTRGSAGVAVKDDQIVGEAAAPAMSDPDESSRPGAKRDGEGDAAAVEPVPHAASESSPAEPAHSADSKVAEGPVSSPGGAVQCAVIQTLGPTTGLTLADDVPAPASDIVVPDDSTGASSASSTAPVDMSIGSSPKVTQASLKDSDTVPVGQVPDRDQPQVTVAPGTWSDMPTWSPAEGASWADITEAEQAKPPSDHCKQGGSGAIQAVDPTSRWDTPSPDASEPSAHAIDPAARWNTPSSDAPQPAASFLPTSTMECAYCHEKGHFIADCRMRPPKGCFACGDPGHISRNCPTAWKRKANTLSNSTISSSSSSKAASAPARPPQKVAQRQAAANARYTTESFGDMPKPTQRRESVVLSYRAPSEPAASEQPTTNTSRQAPYKTVCLICDGDDHRSIHCMKVPGAPLVCKYCLSPDHRRKDCPCREMYKNEECNYCHRIGHVHIDCPFRLPSPMDVERLRQINGCTFCLSPDHVETGCPIRHAVLDAKARRDLSKCKICGDGSHVENYCSTVSGAPLRCRYCGSAEHRQMHCPRHRTAADSKCRHCGRAGHGSIDCPLRSPSLAEKEFAARHNHCTFCLQESHTLPSCAIHAKFLEVSGQQLPSVAAKVATTPSSAIRSFAYDDDDDGGDAGVREAAPRLVFEEKASSCASRAGLGRTVDSRDVVALDTSSPLSVVVCGNDAANTVATLVEGFLVDADAVIVAPESPTALLFHYDDRRVGCRPFDLSIQKRADLPVVSGVVVLVPPGQVERRKALYASWPNCHVRPILFDWSAITAEVLLGLLHVPLGVDLTGPDLDLQAMVLDRFLDWDTLQAFRDAVDRFRPGALASTLDAFLTDQAGDSLAGVFKSGTLVLCDLEDPALDARAACGIFSALLQMLRSAKAVSSKLVVCDRADKYLPSDASFASSIAALAVNDKISTIVSVENAGALPDSMLHKDVAACFILKTESEYYKSVHDRLHLPRSFLGAALRLANRDVLIYSSFWDGSPGTDVRCVRLRKRFTGAQ